MDLYHVARFLHIVTLIVAASVTAVTKLAADRRARSRTVGEALDWHNVLLSASRAFPVCLLAFVVTGAYMVRVLGAHAWANSFVIDGLLGVTLLLASGTYLGIKGKGLKQLLERLASDAPDRPAPRISPPPLVALLPMVNTGIALSVVFDMVIKPPSIAVGLGVIAIGAVASGVIARRYRPVSVLDEPDVVRAA